VRPVREILEQIAAEFHATVAELGRRDTALEAR